MIHACQNFVVLTRPAQCTRTKQQKAAHKKTAQWAALFIQMLPDLARFFFTRRFCVDQKRLGVAFSVHNVGIDNHFADAFIRR